MEQCPGCRKRIRRLTAHLSQSQTCPDAIKYQAERGGQAAAWRVSSGKAERRSTEALPQEQGVNDIPPPHSPLPAGLTEAEVKALLAEGLTVAVGQITEAVNQRLEAERQNTQQQLAQVGPAVLAYLRQEAAKEQASAQAPTPPQQPEAPGNGQDPLSEFVKMLTLFQKPAGGLEQISETIGSIGKLADALDNLRYRPWRDGVDFATQNILQQTRMGIEPGNAAQVLRNNPPNWATRPELPPEAPKS